MQWVFDCLLLSLKILGDFGILLPLMRLGRSMRDKNLVFLEKKKLGLFSFHIPRMRTRKHAMPPTIVQKNNAPIV